MIIRCILIEVVPKKFLSLFIKHGINFESRLLTVNAIPFFLICFKHNLVVLIVSGVFSNFNELESEFWRLSVLPHWLHYHLPQVRFNLKHECLFNSVLSLFLNLSSRLPLSSKEPRIGSNSFLIELRIVLAHLKTVKELMWKSAEAIPELMWRIKGNCLTSWGCLMVGGVSKSFFLRDVGVGSLKRYFLTWWASFSWVLFNLSGIL